jgi:uncharacterized caspase-like protein
MRMWRFMAALVAVLVATTSASAAQKRVALLVAHPFGGPELTPLRYTANDLERVRQVLESLGDFAADDVLTSFGEDAEDVLSRFDDATARLKNANPADGSLFLFYYSGHTKDAELRLGDTRLPLTDLKRAIERTQATLRVALLDSCRAGAITRIKGAVKGEPLAVQVEDSAAQSGQVLITASSENEDAQESDEIQGSFFTHYLTSALRGAGDDDHNGQVTLTEAYSFAYANTVANTVGSKGGIQHPTYRFDLRGAGDVAVTRPGRPTSAIIFPGGLAGHFVVFDADHRVVVAELDAARDSRTRLAVAPGTYVVKKRETDHLRLLRLTVGKDAEVPVDPLKMDEVAFADDYAKGAVVTTEEIRFGKLGVRISATAGAQSFLSAPVRTDYFPTLGLFELSLDFDNALRKNLGVRLDLGLGGSGEQSLVIHDAYVGALTYSVKVSELTLGSAITYTLPLTDWLSLALSGRLGLISVTRTFSDASLPKQAFSTLTPGLGVELDLALTRFLWLGARARMHYMFFNVDEPMSLAFIDGGLVLTAVIR